MSVARDVSVRLSRTWPPPSQVIKDRIYSRRNETEREGMRAKSANEMALRYTHSTDEAKRRAVENLVKPIGPSDESVTNEKGRVAALP